MWYLEWLEIMAIISLACTVIWLSNRVWLLESNSHIPKRKDMVIPKNRISSNFNMGINEINCPNIEEK